MWYSGVVGPSGKVCPIFLVLTIITAVDLMSSGVFKAVTTDNGVEWGINGIESRLGFHAFSLVFLSSYRSTILLETGISILYIPGGDS